MPLIQGKDKCPWCSVVLETRAGIDPEVVCSSCGKPLWWLEWYARAKADNREAEAYPEEMRAVKTERALVIEIVEKVTGYPISYMTNLKGLADAVNMIKADREQVRLETVKKVKNAGSRSQERFGMKWESAYLLKEDVLDAIAEGGEG